MINLVCDLETNNQDKSIWLIGTLNRYDYKIIHHLDLGDWWDYLLSYNDNLNVYFHNLTFDISFLLDFFSQRYQWLNPNQRVSKHENSAYAIIDEFNNFYKLTINHQGLIITFKDSLKMCGQSVAMMAKTFLTQESKGEIDYQKYRKYDDLNDVPLNEIDYINNDLLIVAKMLNSLKFDKYLSASSYSFNRLKFEIGAKKFNHAFNCCDKVSWEMGKDSYFGGFTNGSFNSINNIIENVYAYDINSAYPFIMQSRVVYGNVTPICSNNCAHLYKVIIYHGRLIKDVAIIPKLQRSYGLSHLNYMGKIDYEVRYVWKDEWECWKKFYQLEYQILNVYHFKTTNMCRKFINQLYQKRAIAKLNGDKVNAVRYKIILNSLYGKLGENYKKRSKVIKKCQCNEIEITRKNHIIFNNQYCYQINLKEQKHARNIFTASYITSKVRVMLFNVILKCDHNFIYSDTDCIFSKEKLDVVCNGEIGNWKVDEYKLFKWIRPKAYIGEKVDGNAEIVISGLPKKAQRDIFTWKNDEEKLQKFNYFKVGQYLGKAKIMKTRSNLGTSLIESDFTL